MVLKESNSYVISWQRKWGYFGLNDLGVTYCIRWVSLPSLSSLWASACAQRKERAEAFLSSILKTKGQCCLSQGALCTIRPLAKVSL